MPPLRSHGACYALVACEAGISPRPIGGVAKPSLHARHLKIPESRTGRAQALATYEACQGPRYARRQA
jgi:hypothetical protein